MDEARDGFPELDRLKELCTRLRGSTAPEASGALAGEAECRSDDPAAAGEADGESECRSSECRVSELRRTKPCPSGSATNSSDPGLIERLVAVHPAAAAAGGVSPTA